MAHSHSLVTETLQIVIGAKAALERHQRLSSKVGATVSTEPPAATSTLYSSTQLQFYGPMKSDLAPFLEVCTLCTNSGDLEN